MISITSQCTSILRIISVSTGMRVCFVLSRGEVRTTLWITTFTLIFQNFNVSQVVPNGSRPIFFNGDRRQIRPNRLSIRVLVAYVKVNYTFIAVFVSREDDVCPSSTSNNSFFFRYLNMMANERNPTTTRSTMIRCDLYITPVFIISRCKVPISRRFQIAMGRFGINRPRQIIRTTCPFRVVSVSNDRRGFQSCFLARDSRWFNGQLLVMMTIASRIIDGMRIGLLIGREMVLRLNQDNYSGKSGR